MTAVLSASSAGIAADPSTGPPPALLRTALPLEDAEQQVTFLYYANLAAPQEFYGKVLGLKSYYDQEWVSLYQVTVGATLGVVKASGAQIAADIKRDAVMVSIVTPNVDAWFARLRKSAAVVVLKDIYDHPVVPIRAFLLQDPGGYSIEFFEWRKK